MLNNKLIIFSQLNVWFAEKAWLTIFTRYLYFKTKRETVTLSTMSYLLKLVLSLHVLTLPSFSYRSRDTYKVRSCFQVHSWFSSLWMLLLNQVKTISGKETVVEVPRKGEDSKSGSHVYGPDYSNLESEYGNVECKNQNLKNVISDGCNTVVL